MRDKDDGLGSSWLGKSQTGLLKVILERLEEEESAYNNAAGYSQSGRIA